MDGTKPAMDSNAEETQDEGQESKGSAISRRHLRLFGLIKGGEREKKSPIVFPRVCATSGLRLCATQ